MTSTAEETAPLRADAERNRAKLVAAARAVFAEQGLEAPLEEIARRAGVGIATLYRRFPVREALIAATFADRMAGYAAAARQALADPCPWTGFSSFVRQWSAMQVDDRGLGDVMTLSLPDSDEFELRRREAYAAFLELVARAQAAGELRADFAPEDFVMLMMANAGIIHAGGAAAGALSARLVEFVLQGSRASAAVAVLPAPPTADQVHAAMCR